MATSLNSDHYLPFLKRGSHQDSPQAAIPAAAILGVTPLSTAVPNLPSPSPSSIYLSTATAAATAALQQHPYIATGTRAVTTTVTSTVSNLFDNTTREYVPSTNSTIVVPVFPEYIRVVATIFCCLVFVVGVAGNLLVTLVILKDRDMRHSTNYFLMNLSVADLLVLLFCLPPVLVELHSPPQIWVLGYTMCQYYTYCLFSFLQLL